VPKTKPFVPTYTHAELKSEFAQCTYVDWYKFRQCTVQSCKNCTDRTEHRCLGVDRVQPAGNKTISDAELHYFKLHKLGYSTKYVSVKRKEAIKKVQAILVLNKFLQYVAETYKNRPHLVFVASAVTAIEGQYPLNLDRLIYENWMLNYLVSNKVWNRFKKGKLGEIQDLTLPEVLGMSSTVYHKILSTVKEIRNVGQQNTSNNDHKPTRSRKEQLIRVGSQHQQPKR